ncbi:MAG: AtpZ/AtpI family protein [Elusimicrobia bacterium]|nr:AtpZ/AtpI family protein [Elusimicrobiota bacterium]
MPVEQKPEVGPASPRWTDALAAGTELAAAVFVGVGGGWWLDSVLGTLPGLTVLGAMAGMAFGLYRLVKLSRVKRGSR